MHRSPSVPTQFAADVRSSGDEREGRSTERAGGDLDGFVDSPLFPESLISKHWLLSNSSAKDPHHTTMKPPPAWLKADHPAGPVPPPPPPSLCTLQPCVSQTAGEAGTVGERALLAPSQRTAARLGSKIFVIPGGLKARMLKWTPVAKTPSEPDYDDEGDEASTRVQGVGGWASLVHGGEKRVGGR
ncbi:unnamed protein product [Pleuronectes platessa]|uniref:Uncharacterized protein n=1 Tax=Pleuronectes platessa TaxID=8262 RepID=A0A9N7Z1S9_PLEPL|nr:unnamed protein product [Pleuronectes platessa]